MLPCLPHLLSNNANGTYLREVYKTSCLKEMRGILLSTSLGSLSLL